MTSQSSGGSGSGLPGVTGDGLTPGGEIIAGALTAGDSAAASVPSLHTLYGGLTIREVPGNIPDQDQLLILLQSVPLTADSLNNGLLMSREGALNGHDYTQPFLQVNDLTAGSGPVVQFRKNGLAQFQVDGDGVQVHGKFKTGAAVTHTLGAYSGKSLPIYDESGTLVGYAPCYA